MGAIRATLRRLLAGERGATAIEYGLIASLLAISLIGSLSLLGGGADGMWTKLATTLNESM